jgi:hypothetical protein
MESIFAIDDQSKYSITVHKVELEDVPDNFITKTDLEELVGDQVYDGGWLRGGESQTYKLNAVIESDIARYKAEMITSGKKSVIIDEDLVNLFTQDSNRHATAYIQTYDNTLRFSKGKIHIKPVIDPVKRKQSLKPNRSMATALAYMAGDVLTRKHGFAFKLGYASNSPREAIELIKKVLTWDEISTRRNYHGFSTEQLKEVWDNPEIFAAKTTK